MFDFSPQLLNRCRYPRLKSDTGTVIMIDADYFIQWECRRAFEACNWRVIPISLDPPQQIIEKLLTAVILHQPDLLFTVNHLGFDQNGLLTELIEKIELPVVSWFVDSPPYILLDHRLNASQLVLTPIWERHYENFLKQFGFSHTFHLPLAADPETARYSPSMDKKFQVGFVGDSMISPVEKWRRMCRVIDKSDQIISAAANKLLNQRSADPLKLVQDTALQLGSDLSALNKEKELTFSSAVVLDATRRYREQIMNTLPQCELHIFGDSGWREYAPEDAVLHANVDYYSELPSIYNATSINLNSTSLQMPTALNQRVFDAPLNGGFLLTDYQEDLELLFDCSRETATFSNFEDLKHRVSYYLAHDSLCKSLTNKARARILRDHTYKHRISEIIRRARARFGDKQFQVAHHVEIT